MAFCTTVFTYAALGLSLSLATARAACGSARVAHAALSRRAHVVAHITLRERLTGGRALYFCAGLPLGTGIGGIGVAAALASPQLLFPCYGQAMGIFRAGIGLSHEALRQTEAQNPHRGAHGAYAALALRTSLRASRNTAPIHEAVEKTHFCSAGPPQHAGQCPCCG